MTDPGRPRPTPVHAAGRRLLAAVSFPCLIVAALLAWRAYQAAAGRLGPVPAWQVTLYAVGAAAAVGVGLAGVRQRHRRGDGEGDATA